MTIKGMFLAQEGRCFYCAGKCWCADIENRTAARARLGVTPGLPRAKLTIAFRKASEEHLIRKVDGGQRGDNLVMACCFCNSHRGETKVVDHKAAMLALAAAGQHPCHGINMLARKRRPWRAAPAGVPA